jgi:drug/metabolite transporter (DMT)-like permease
MACLLWSAGWLFLKVGLREIPPITFASLRLGLALVVLALIVAWRREWRLLSASNFPSIALSGLLLLGVNYALTFWGAQHLPSALTSVLQATSPAIGYVIATLIGAERFTVVRGAALVLGIAGVALISRAQSGTGDMAVLGTAAVLGGALCAATAYAIAKRRITHLPPSLTSATQTLCAFVVLFPAALLIDGSPTAIAWTPAALTSLLYLGLASSVVAFWLNYWLLQRMTATAVLSMALVQPLIAAALGAMLLNERFDARAAVGGVMILTSAAVILRSART